MKRLCTKRVWLKSWVFAATLATPIAVVAATGAPEPDPNGPVVPSTGSPPEAAGPDSSQTSYQPGSREPPRERQETPAAQSDFMPAAQEGVRVRPAPASQSDYQPGAAEGR